jgi:hypothetical protein
MAKKTHEEILNIPGHKENANQDHINISHPVTMAFIRNTTNVGAGGAFWWECKLVQPL